MPSLYLCPYLVNEPPSSRFEACIGESARELWAAIRGGEWPYDLGDDPSYFVADKTGGPVTWGVCRPDVRSRVSVGDIVAFFAVDQRSRQEPKQYIFVGAHTVAAKVSHQSIHVDQDLAHLRDYFNLLIRPKARGWEQFEPSLRRRQWHDNWLWRIVAQGCYEREVVDAATEVHEPGRALRIERSPATLANNYIVFCADPARSITLSARVRVAEFDRGDPHERWLDTGLAKSIRGLTLDLLNRNRDQPRFLRTSNRSFPHPYARVCIPDSKAWMSQLRAAVQGIDA